MRNYFTYLLMTLPLFGACSLQDIYSTPVLAKPEVWSSAVGSGVESPANWWVTLEDPAIDHLVEASFASSPTLAQAVARMDEARANLGVSEANQLPNLTATASTKVTDTQQSGGGNTGAAFATGQIGGRSTVTSASPTLSWELDLFGRLRNAVEASKATLDARTADAQNTKLALAAEVANTTVALRACRYAVETKQADVASQETTLSLTRAKVGAGFSAPVDEASALREASTAKSNLAAQQEQCERNVNALVALTGKNRNDVVQEVSQPLAQGAFVPTPPKAQAQLPAIVLASHPTVRAADHDAAAAWAQIGVARADRFPKIDLAAALSGQWLSIAGSTTRSLGWSVAPSISAVLFDAGKGAANQDAAEARYRNAVAVLDNALRTTVKEVENALAAQQSAEAQLTAASEAERAAKIVVSAREAGWKQGLASMLELEDARRQFRATQNTAIAAAQARAKAWVDLVSATGNAMTNMKDETQ